MLEPALIFGIILLYICLTESTCVFLYLLSRVGVLLLLCIPCSREIFEVESFQLISKQYFECFHKLNFENIQSLCYIQGRFIVLKNFPLYKLYGSYTEGTTYLLTYVQAVAMNCTCIHSYSH